MGAVRQNILVAFAAGVAICASQLPEFAQQYRQRIGGAIDELGRVVAEFDRDASTSGLTRAQALDLHRQSTEALFRARGQSAQASIDRLDTLSRQQAEFESTSPLMQPFVMTSSDGATLAGTWQVFKPAVPVTTAGLAWGGAGFVGGSALALLITSMLRWTWRRTTRRRQPVAPRPRTR